MTSGAGRALGRPPHWLTPIAQLGEGVAPATASVVVTFCRRKGSTSRATGEELAVACASRPATDSHLEHCEHQDFG